MENGPGTVFHVPDGDESYGRRAFRNAANLLADESVDGRVVLVCNGSGIEHLCQGTPHGDRVAELIGDGASVYACRNSLDSRNYETADLVDGVEVTPTAMGELTRRQQAGYAYVRP